eukprot:COSAG05_NODE_18675_length_304_cov_3.224390_1_plen_40_part_10
MQVPYKPSFTERDVDAVQAAFYAELSYTVASYKRKHPRQW